MKKTRYFLLLLLFGLSGMACSRQGSQQEAGPGTLAVANLKCEYRTDPLGIETPAPRFSWELHSGQRNVMQAAYRILVADSPEALRKEEGNMWDTKKVVSDQSIQVVYRGKTPGAAKRYYWKVKVWDNRGNTSAWSEPALWQMGLPLAGDWQGAGWIGYEAMPDSARIVPALHGKGSKALGDRFNVLPLLRKEFRIKNPVQRATMYISGLGHFELSLNGKKVGDHFLDPGWTDYDTHALYVTFDVTGQVKQGGNALGVMLGNGFYHVPGGGRYRKLTGSFGYPKMICRLVLEYTDGSTEDIISDSSWKTAPGPITFSSIYGGEDYDARLQQPGWDQADFQEDASWKPALAVEGPEVLDPQIAAPVKVMEKFAPVAVSQPEPGKWVYDLGQNASGIVRIAVRGKQGATVKIIPGELLKENGEVSQKATGSPYYFAYTLKGGGTETWQPRFSYYGFRYVQVEGGVPEGKENPEDLPVVVSLEGLHIRNSALRTGQFSSSSDLFNKTEKLIDWAIKSNMVSVFTDCPHREKLGWLEQAHLMGSSIRYSYDIAGLCTKIVHDMQAAQTPEGLIPNIAPEYTVFNFKGDTRFRDSPEWGSNGIIMPWYMYKWYGDKRVLAGSYPMMQKYMAYLKDKSTNHIVSHGLSDWYDLGPERPGFSQLTPDGVTATAIYYYDLGIMEKVAGLLGKPGDAGMYRALARKVKEAFNNTFFDKETGQYASGSQTANAMAVYMDLVPSGYKEKVVHNIVKNIRENRLTAGDIGYRYLLRVLDNEGLSDVIYDMNSRSDVPGYGYQLARGATALTESWQALPVVSNNHFMLGHLKEWFYSGLGGIRLPENAIAYKTIAIRPDAVEGVTSASASTQCPYGVISTAWEKNPGAQTFALRVQVPANTTATIYLPASEGAEILEGDTPVTENDAIRAVGYENGRALLEIGSGEYRFLVKNK